MTADQNEEKIRSAFDQLRSDTQKVDVMKAMHNITNGSSGSQSNPRKLQFAAVGAAVVVLAAASVTWFQLRSDDTDQVEASPAVTSSEPTTDTPQDTATTAAPSNSDTTNNSDDTADSDNIPAETTFADLACGENQQERSSTAKADVNQVRSITSFESSDCRRTVFTFSKKGSPSPSVGRATGIQYKDAEGHVQQFDLPADWDTALEDIGGLDEVESVNTQNGFAAVVSSQNPYILVDHGKALTTHTFLANPARLVVDTVLTSGQPAAPKVEAGIYIRSLIDSDDFDCCAKVSGVGMAFESIADVELVDAETNEPVKANWSGNSVMNNPQQNVSGIGFQVGNWTWNEFEFTIDNLSSGNYKLVFNQAPDFEDPKGLEVPFTVKTDI